MILVTGATGATGRRVVQLLLARGVPCRAFVRDAAAATAILGDGVELHTGDFENAASLAAAMVGVEKLFLLSPADPRQVEQQGRAVELAQAAGVRHIVKMSALGAAQDSRFSLGRWHRGTELQIEESGLEFTHLRPHYFMQNTFNFAPSISRDGCIYAPMKDGRISLVDRADVAAVAVQALIETGHAGKIYDITGPEALSFADIAAHIGKAIGREIRYVDIPPVEAERQMIASGLPDWLADAMIGLLRLFADGHASSVSPVVESVCGRPPQSFAAFAHLHAGRFKSQA